MGFAGILEDVTLGLRKAAGRLMALHRREGPVETASAVLRRGLELLLLEREIAHFVFSLAAMPSDRRPPPGVDYGDLTPEEISALARFLPHAGPWEIRRRLDRGHICHVARAGGRIVMCGWSGGGKIRAPIIGRAFTLPAQWAYGYNFYIHPEYRGRFLLPLFLSRMGAVLRDRGFVYWMSFVDSSTGIPFRAYIKTVRAHRMILIRYRRVLGFWKNYSCREVPLGSMMPRSARRAR